MGVFVLFFELFKGLVVMNMGFNVLIELMDLLRVYVIVKMLVVGELLVEVFGLVFNGLLNVQNDFNLMLVDVIDFYV